jgi:hypothetical protein
MERGAVAQESTAEPALAAPPQRILFFLHSLGYLRFFDSVIRLLLDRGHRVHLLIERDDHEPNEADWLAEMSLRTGFSCSVTTSLASDRWRGVATKLRRSSDYVRYLGPEFRDTPHLVSRARGRAPDSFLWLAGLKPFRSEQGRRRLLRALLLLERAVPSSNLLEEEIAGHDPDVLVLSPHLMPGARHSEYIKSARALGIRTCVCIASWDNLSSKQLLREAPDRVVVWNEIQRREAEEIHGIPAERVVVTGAQCFDHWFGWQARPRAEFGERIGLEHDQRYVLYLGGSLFPGVLTEAEYVRDRWLPALRLDPELGRLQVLVRPHPSRMPEWRAARLDELDGVAMWPRGGNEMPVDALARADFYDSIFHSVAVVGLNTSAMIETAIVDRPVLALLVPEFKESQVGTFHFDYLLTVGGGLLRLAGSLDEHVGQLRETLESGDREAEERNRRFVETFVRPRGLEHEATPLVVGAIEELTAEGALGGRRSREWRLLPVRAVLGGYIYAKALRWKVAHRFAKEPPGAQRIR